MKRHAHMGSRALGRYGFVPILLLIILLATSSVVVALPERPGQSKLAEATVPPPPPVVYFQPNPVEVGWGTARNVDVVVENATGVFAVEMRIAFPHSLVQVTDADPSVAGIQIGRGDFFDGFDTYTIINAADNGTGTIEYIISITGSEVGKTGDGVVATIPLHSLAMGNAIMSFVEIILCERDGTSIPLIVRDEQAPIHVVDETSTPTSTPGGAAATPTNTQIPGAATPTKTNTPPAAPANVRVIPVFQQIPVSNTQTVQVSIEGTTDLYGYEVRLNYNGTFLDVEDADGVEAGVQVYMGDVFDAFSYQVLENSVTDDGLFGEVHFTAFVNSGPPQGFAGDGILFWIRFHGVSPGLSNITLSEVQILNRVGTTMSRTLYHGEIEVIGTAPSSTPTMTLTPTGTLTTVATETYTPGPSLTPSTTPTQTLTATPTGSTTAGPTPTETGVLATPTPVCADRIENGSFEDIDAGEALPWVRTGNTSYTTIEQHTGNRSAWLGGYNNADDGLYQQVTVPSPSGPGEQITEATLTYWWGMTTQEVSHAFDFLKVRIRSASGDLLQELETISDGSISGIWQESTYDLSAYEGQTIRICFEATTDGSNATSFHIDDVKLIICEILQPTPTGTATGSPTISPTATETGQPTLTPTITSTPVVETLQYDEVGYTGCYDTYINGWDPTENYGHNGAVSVRSPDVKRPMFYFDVSIIPAGVTIMNAHLSVHASHYKSHSQDMTVTAYGLKRSWAEMETTWHDANVSTMWSTSGADNIADDRDENPTGSTFISETSIWYDIDITSLVQEWVNGRPNNGLILIASGNTVEMSFWSSEYSIKDLRPKLVVQYVFGSVPTPTATPDVTATTGPSPTPTQTIEAGPEMVFQKGLLGYDGVEDTYLSQWQPEDNYGGGVTMMARQADVRACLVRFDLTALPATANVTDATLELYSVSRSNAGTLTVSAYEVLRPWAEGQATWNQAMAAVAWGVGGCNQEALDRAANPVDACAINSVDTWNEWDVTGLVQNWVNSPASNYGVVLKGSGPTSVEYTFAASEYWWAETLSPKLTVRYTTS